jgi:hypothetical protein
MDGCTSPQTVRNRDLIKKTFHILISPIGLFESLLFAGFTPFEHRQAEKQSKIMIGKAKDVALLQRIMEVGPYSMGKSLCFTLIMVFYC